jgi:pimeloyl-ACP methyl ester carboxylesterase
MAATTTWRGLTWTYSLMSEVTREQFMMGDAQLSMLTAGHETGEPVVLLHGIPASAELWRDGLSKLSQAGFRVYAPDLPGYGQTRLSPNGDHSLKGAAELFAAWLKEAKLPPIWLVGHDLGGGVAQIMVTHHPDLINRLTLSHAAVEAFWPVGAVRLSRFLARLGVFQFLAAAGIINIDPFMARELQKAVANKEILKRGDIRRRIFYDSKLSDPQGRQAFSAHLVSLDNAQTVAVAPKLSHVQVPTLLLWGRNDPFQPWEITGKRLHQLLPQAQVKVLDQAGHFVMLDQPDAFYQALIDWRSEVQATT